MKHHLCCVAMAWSIAVACVSCSNPRGAGLDPITQSAADFAAQAARVPVPSTAQTQTIPLPAAPRVIVTREFIAFDNAAQIAAWPASSPARAQGQAQLRDALAQRARRSLVALRDGALPVEVLRGGAGGMLIDPLFAVAQRAASLARARDHERAGEVESSEQQRDAQQGTAVLFIEKDAPFATVARVLYTLGQAEFERMLFAVRSTSSDDARGFEFVLPSARSSEASLQHDRQRLAQQHFAGDQELLRERISELERVLSALESPSRTRPRDARRAASAGADAGSDAGAGAASHRLVSPTLEVHVEGVTVRWHDGSTLAPDCQTRVTATPDAVTVARAGSIDERALRACLLRALNVARREGDDPSVVTIRPESSAPFGDVLQAAMATRAGEDGREPFAVFVFESLIL